MGNRHRLDVTLVERGFFPSREQAQRAIMAGEITIADRVVDKPSLLVATNLDVSVAVARKYVGRGGFKLEGALDHFGIVVAGLTALDIGASTGGFTDCLLQRGAERVYAVDVGHGQLAWKLRINPKVVVKEKLNARHLTKEHIPEPVSVCVIDVSFISLTLVLPSATALLLPRGFMLALIKPQFELEATDVGRGGVVRDASLHNRAQNKIVSFAARVNLNVIGIVPAAIKGLTGNQEFVICLQKP